MNEMRMICMYSNSPIVVALKFIKINTIRNSFQLFCLIQVVLENRPLSGCLVVFYHSI